MSAEYQVRLEWGLAAVAAEADASAPADVLVFVGAPPPEIVGFGLVLHADVDSAATVAARVLAEQERIARRAMVLIVALGTSWPDGSLRPSVADHLAAGVLVDALAELGIDFHSPACAVAAAAANGLSGAIRSLIRAAS